MNCIENCEDIKSRFMVASHEGENYRPSTKVRWPKHAMLFPPPIKNYREIETSNARMNHSRIIHCIIYSSEAIIRLVSKRFKVSRGVVSGTCE